MSFDYVSIPRRMLLKFATTLLAIVPAILAGSAALATDAVIKNTVVAVNTGIVRVASVSTSVEGGLLPALVESFKAETGLNVILIRDDEPYDPAKEGKYDLVISHFGHRDVEDFVVKGFGLWPRTVFSNQLCLFGPPSDPAKVRGMTDLVKAFQKIAAAKAPYVLNETKGLKYLTEILWNAAGHPSKGSWFINSGTSKKDAIALAADHKAYVLWGLTPFMREQITSHRKLVPLVTADPMLQRIMVSVVVNPEHVPGVNETGAIRFQKFLLSPATQAKVLTFHYPGVKQAVWMPAGRHNAGPSLPEW
ncbi:MAG: substrate-binding domain-containing protein [Desulfuromonadales bacterium]|nr:substrate-binding domain-containing protein [Desulfuromonadales bacterium]